jgi:hypothetical protein
MSSRRFQELSSKGYSLYEEWREGEMSRSKFDWWVRDCEDALALCIPEQVGIPLFAGPGNIEDIIMLLEDVAEEIQRGDAEYLGI